jgi:peptidoglycan DL-endopeptidase CwlO
VVTGTAGAKIADGAATPLFHTGWVSIDAVVRQVGELLTRAHTLFGDPPTSGGPAAAGAGAHLAGAGRHAHTGRRQMAGASGRLAGGHGLFAGAAGARLSTLAGSDEQLGERLDQAAGTDRRGRAASGAVLDAAAADLAALAPLCDTPGGQHALLSALRARVAQQQGIVADTQARAAAAAAGLRALNYQPTAPITGPDDPTTGASRQRR